MIRTSRSFGRTQLFAALLFAAGLLPSAGLAQPTVAEVPKAPAEQIPDCPAFDESNATRPTFTVSDLPQGRPLRIIVYGDMRFTNASNTTDTAPGVRKWLAQKVAEERPDLLLLTGDMPFHGSSPDDWKIYEEETASWKAEHLRIYPTLGNHEVITDRKEGEENYFKAYPQISGCPYYSVQLGNIYLITLDSTNFISPGWPQRVWLEQQLTHLPASVDFVFFLVHVPMVADLQTSFMLGLPSEESLRLRKFYEEQAAKSHAKFVIFNGHIHNYERFEINGITHLITGGGGARPYPVFLRGDQDLYSGNTYPNFNYVLITLQGKRADAQMFRVEDPYGPPEKMHVELKDSFTLEAK